jgi:hypothetical protein
VTITIEATTKPTAATNSFGVPVATAWRNFSNVLSSASAINPDAFSDVVLALTIAASHLEALGLDASELDVLIGDLESVAATLHHVDCAISDLLARKRSDWPTAGSNIAA